MSEAMLAMLGPDPFAGAVRAVLLVNGAAAAAVAAVAIARVPVRRLCGPATAYQLWGAIPLTLLFSTLLVCIPLSRDQVMSLAAPGLPHARLIATAWALGAAAMIARFVLAQIAFNFELRAGRAGPAVVGFIAPRIVMPADDGRYTAAERELIRAHERAHVARKDPRITAIATVFQCLSWFNPAAHLAAHLLRLDQELACDAAVVMNRPGARGLYARTLLKTQLASQALPFGCYWPARGAHPLEVRIAMLKTRGRSFAGGPVQPPPVDAIRP